MKRWLVALACGTSVGLAACSDPVPPAPTVPEAFLELVDIAPPRFTVLRKGSSVQMSITVRSEIASPGRLTLSIKDQAGTALLVPEPSADIGARGQAIFQAAFVVPANASLITVSVDFRLPGASTVMSALGLSYRTE